MTALPEWPPGTVAVLSTAGGAPHAIPVSTAVRAGDAAILLALAARRESLARLRADPRCALTVMAEGVAFTAHGTAEVLAPVSGESVLGVRLRVEAVQDHGGPQFAIEAGVRWRWTEEAAAARDREVRAALSRLGS